MVIVRAEKSGVWAGDIESRNGTEVVSSMHVDCGTGRGRHP